VIHTTSLRAYDQHDQHFPLGVSILQPETGTIEELRKARSVWKGRKGRKASIDPAKIDDIGWCRKQDSNL
jgi:hypothetical protein